jgi:hypothetical protein
VRGGGGSGCGGCGGGGGGWGCAHTHFRHPAMFVRDRQGVRMQDMEPLR